jgi:hypothetical protein
MLTIQKVKFFKGMEGMGGFNAELVFNGKPVAFVIDDDCGGCLNWHWYQGKGDVEGAKAALKAMPEYKKCREEFPTLGEGEAIDSAMRGIIMQFEEEKSLKRWCKTKIVWRSKIHKEGEYGIWKAPYTLAHIAAIKAKHPDAEIINERFIGKPTV